MKTKIHRLILMIATITNYQWMRDLHLSQIILKPPSEIQILLITNHLKVNSEQLSKLHSLFKLKPILKNQQFHQKKKSINNHKKKKKTILRWKI